MIGVAADDREGTGVARTVTSSSASNQAGARQAVISAAQVDAIITAMIAWCRPNFSAGQLPRMLADIAITALRMVRCKKVCERTCSAPLSRILIEPSAEGAQTQPQGSSTAVRQAILLSGSGRSEHARRAKGMLNRDYNCSRIFALTAASTLVQIRERQRHIDRRHPRTRTLQPAPHRGRA